MTISLLASRAACAAVAALAAGLLAAGCSSPAHPAAQAGSTPPATRAPAASPGSSHISQYLPHTSPPVVTPSASAAPGPVEPVAQPVTAGPGPCPASGLRLRLGSPNGAAGSIYYPIQFTNVSGQVCTMYGYPGVSFAAGDGGPVIGGPAVRNPTFPSELVTVAAGQTVHATLQVAIAQNYPAALCKPVTASWLAVYPPASYVPLYLPFTAQTCTGRIPSGSTLGIYVVRPGATGP